MRRKFIAISLAATWIVLGYANSVAWADGGAVRFSERRGDRVVTVFTSPTPLRAGPADVSVLLLDADSGQPVLGIPIVVEARPIQGGSPEIRAPATGAAATNKLLSAAQLDFAEPGLWQVSIEVQGLSPTPPLSFEVEVAEPLPPWLHFGVWIAWPLVPIGLFGCHQWLTLRRRRISAGRHSQTQLPGNRVKRNDSGTASPIAIAAVSKIVETTNDIV